MNELSLFTGGGGGLLTGLLVGWHPVGYVENDSYCQQIIKARINDRIIPNAPIFGDIRTFISEGYAAAYTGLVDIVTAGFPCQGWSAIGKQRGETDPRNMWPETVDVISIVRPQVVWLENSPNIMSKGFVFQIIEDLSALGYVGRATRVSGLHAGAHTKRERAWIKAELSNPTCERLERGVGCVPQGHGEAETGSIQALGKNKIRMDLPDPGTFGGYHGLANRVDRTKAIGNGWIPAVAQTAWEILK